MKPGSWSTQKLAAEAAAMEARLTALKLELQKDKARREAAAVSCDGNKQASIWSNGKPMGPLRKTGGTPSTAGSNKQPMHAADSDSKTLACSKNAVTTAARRSSVTSSSSTSRPAVPHMAAAQGSRTASRGATASNSINSGRSATVRPSSCSSTSSSGSLDTGSSDTPSKAANPKPHWLRQLKEQQQTQPTVGQQQVPHTSSHNAAAEHTSSEAAGCLADGSCLADEPCQQASLLTGTYDEAAAASSFQEALLHWCQAGPCSTTNASTTAITPSGGSSSRALGSCKQAQSSESSEAHMGVVQTPTTASDAVAASQHTMQHGSTSTSASTSAGGGSKPVNGSVAAFLQKLTMRSSSSDQAGTAATPTMSPAASLDSGMPARRPSCSDVGTEHPSSIMMAGVEGSRDAAGHVGTHAQHQQQAGVLQGADANPEHTDDHSSSDAASLRCPQAFDSWLAQAEQAAAALGAPGEVHAGSSITLGSPRTHSPCDRAPDKPPEMTAAVGQYHRQLESVLAGVEDLEAKLQSRMQPTPWLSQADA